MADIYSMTDTWNNGGTLFSALKMNVTDTASSGSSLLMDLQVGGASKMSVTKAGTLTVAQSIVSSGNVFLGGVGATLRWGGATRFISNVDGDVSLQTGASVEQFAIKSGVMMPRARTVATLPNASTHTGGFAYVTDATDTTPRSTVAGGGSNKVLVMSDGTNWIIV